MRAQALRDFLLLFATIDPIGALAIFVPLTASKTHAERRRIGHRAVLVAGGVLLAFLILGEVVLSAMGVRLPSFALAGGIILFLFSLQMIFGDVSAHAASPEAGHDISVFPIAMPAIASPGAILAVVLLTENHTHTFAQQILTTTMLLAVLGIVWGTFEVARSIHALIGNTGTSILVRVMGILLASLAAEEIVQAITHLIKDGH